MQQTNLLVIDRSPEAAEQVNSVLRNSGIKIHVLHARSSTEVKRCLDNDAPVLILYADADETDATLAEINQLTQAFNVPLALFTSMDDPEHLTRLLTETSCFVINRDHEDLLNESVTRLVAVSEAARGQDKQKQVLEELQHRYNLLLDSSRDAIAYIHEGLHVYSNKAYLDALQLKNEDDIAALSLLEMLDTGNTDLKALLRGLSKGKYPDIPLDATVKRPDGTDFQASLTFSPAKFDGEDCTQMMMQRNRSDTALAAELDKLRFTDMLTKLSNRKAFSDKLEATIKEGPGPQSIAVLYLEPDGIDKLESDLNVDTMDAYISDLAALISRSTQEGDTTARISDHGFAVLASRKDAAELEVLAEKLLEAFRSHVFEIEDLAFSISCSIGLTNLGRLPASSNDVLVRARKAQAEASQKGDSYKSYRPELTAVSSDAEDPQWVERIKYALGNGDFYSVQQSIIDLDGDGDNLVENITFMRAEDSDHPPAEFLEIADRNDLGATIDRYVIPELLKTMADREENQIINLSNNSILDYGFPGWLAEQLKASCVEGSKIILQISAESAQNNLRPAQRLMKELEPMGCKLSISAFDGELRAKQLLDHLDVSFVKMPSALTRDLTSSSKNQELVRKVVDVTDPKEVAVIADEVADTSSLAVLWQCGVKLIAGAFLKDSSQVLAQ